MCIRAKVDDHDAFLDEVASALEARFGINHVTVQVELGPGCTHDHDGPRAAPLKPLRGLPRRRAEAAGDYNPRHSRPAERPC